MRYFFIEQAATETPTSFLTGSDARHIKTVLRLKPGDKIGLFDGKGFEYEASIVALSSGRVEVSVIRRFPSKTESPVQITIAQAFLKAKKMDGLVRQLTELGITKWIPFVAQRSVSRPDRKQLQLRTERWNKIAQEALKQCRRGRMPEICPTLSVDEVLALGQAHELKIVFWENESKPINILFPKQDRKFNNIFAMLGPEGGLTEQEIESARSKGFVTAALGPRILKAETATIAACALLQYTFGDMGQKNLDKKRRF